MEGRDNGSSLASEEIKSEMEDEVEIFQAAAFVRETQPSNPSTIAETSTNDKFINTFDDLKSELGLEESEPQDQSDYETHYQMAIAYKEMGLMEEAIKA